MTMNMGTASPLVSVVIPAYNAERYVGDTLRSVLDQSYAKLEVLVIDDGSIDATPRIAHSANDPRVTVLSFANGGPSRARNRGLERVSGDFVCFLDSDDLWDRDKIRRQLLVMEDPEFLAVGSKMRYLSADGRAFGECGFDPTKPKVQAGLRLASGMPFPISSMMFRAAAVRVVGGFDEALEQAEDLDLLSRVSVFGKVGWVPERLGGYRVHAQSTTAMGHREQRGLTQFVQARAKARTAGHDLALADFFPMPRASLAQRRALLGAVWTRAAGVNMLNRRPFSAAVYGIGAVALRPVFVLRRASQRSGLARSR